MYDDATRGQESPDRPPATTSNQRLLADGGQTVHGTTAVCPECDDTDIRQRMQEKAASWSDGPRWRCDECGATFDEPVERAKRDRGGRRGLAKKLARADPDDLATDGGAEMVYVTSRKNGPKQRYHTERDCTGLTRANRVYEKPREAVEGSFEECTFCRGEFEPNPPDGNPRETRGQLLDMDPEDLSLTPVGERSNGGGPA